MELRVLKDLVASMDLRVNPENQELQGYLVMSVNQVNLVNPVCRAFLDLRGPRGIEANPAPVVA